MDHILCNLSVMAAVYMARKASRTASRSAAYLAETALLPIQVDHLLGVVGSGPRNANVLPPSAYSRCHACQCGQSLGGLHRALLARISRRFARRQQRQDRRYSSGTDIANLDVYYEDCVIGGRGAFVVAIHDRD
jgi:hypothetical protein